MSLRVLFLCDRNSVRSPMAAAMLCARGMQACSAGLVPESFVNPFAVAAMAEKGLDISGHQPQGASPASIDEATLVIALTGRAFTLAQEWRHNARFDLEFWDLPDVPDPEGPRELVLWGYRSIYDALAGHIRNRFGL